MIMYQYLSYSTSFRGGPPISINSQVQKGRSFRLWTQSKVSPRFSLESFPRYSILKYTLYMLSWKLSLFLYANLLWARPHDHPILFRVCTSPPMANEQNRGAFITRILDHLECILVKPRASCLYIT